MERAALFTEMVVMPGQPLVYIVTAAVVSPRFPLGMIMLMHNRQRPQILRHPYRVFAARVQAERMPDDNDEPWKQS